MDGYPDGSFRPDESVSREEIASVLARVNELPLVGEDTFTDTSGSWARSAIGAVQEARIMGGYPDGSYRPKAALTRAELVTLMNRLLKRGPLAGIKVPAWPDVDAGHWAFGDIEEASRNHNYNLSGAMEVWQGQEDTPIQ